MKEQVWFVKVKRPWASPKRFMEAIQALGLSSEVSRVDSNAGSRTELTVFASFTGMQKLREQAELEYAVMTEGDFSAVAIKCYGNADATATLYHLNCYLEEFLFQDDVDLTCISGDGEQLEIRCTDRCADFLSSLVGDRLLCGKVAC